MAAVHLTSLKLFYDEGVKGEQHYVFLLCYVYIYIFISIFSPKKTVQYHTLHLITTYGLLPYINPSLVYSSEIPLAFFRNIHKY